MKKSVKYLFAAALLFTGMAANAQDVDGISLWDTYTKAQLIAKYGQPVEYTSQEDTEVYFALIENIKFKDVSIQLIDHKVVDISIKTDKPRAMTKFISGGIGIGDPESVTGKLTKYFGNKCVEDGRIIYSYYFPDDSCLIVSVKNGRVIRIIASATTT